MNIFIRTYSGKCVCRPDTTWDRKSEDYFVPDLIDEFGYTPVLFARICKSGKCIAPQFAERYFDAIGFGLLLYAGSLMDGSPEGFAAASCLDHTACLPLPMYDKVTLGQDGNVFRLWKGGSLKPSDNEGHVTNEGGELLFEAAAPSAQMVDEALVDITSGSLVRIGDFAVAELAPMSSLSTRQDGTVAISGSWCRNPILDFKVIF